MFLLVLSFNIAPTVGIIGGSTAAYSYFPFFFRVIVNGQTCGGTLITPNVVLTSANCLYHEKRKRWAYPQEVRVLKTAKTHKLGRERTLRYTCERYARHEYYDPAKFGGLVAYDIAVILLRVCVDLENPENEVLSLCTAYGQYSEGNLNLFVSFQAFNHSFKMNADLAGILQDFMSTRVDPPWIS